MDDETREEALTLVRGGFLDRDEVVDGLVDYLEHDLSAPVEWHGSVNKRSYVNPLSWQLRLG
jgi:hypothetical protein